jgi:hypothetical protein
MSSTRRGGAEFRLEVRKTARKRRLARCGPLFVARSAYELLSALRTWHQPDHHQRFLPA